MSDLQSAARVTPEPPYWLKVVSNKDEFVVGQVVKAKSGGVLFFVSTLPRELRANYTPKILDRCVLDYLLRLDDLKGAAVHFRGTGMVYKLGVDMLRSVRGADRYRTKMTTQGKVRDYFNVPVVEWQIVSVKEPLSRPKVSGEVCIIDEGEDHVAPVKARRQYAKMEDL